MPALPPSTPHTRPSVTALPAARADPSAICQQKSGLQPAQEDGHEYLCFCTSISPEAGRTAGTAVHAETWQNIGTCTFRKTDKSLSHGPPAGTRTGPVETIVLGCEESRKREKGNISDHGSIQEKALRNRSI